MFGLSDDTIPECDRRTDGRTDGRTEIGALAVHQRCMACYPTEVENTQMT